jgi:hypothetical protein
VSITTRLLRSHFGELSLASQVLSNNLHDQRISSGEMIVRI